MSSNVLYVIGENGSGQLGIKPRNSLNASQLVSWSKIHPNIEIKHVHNGHEYTIFVYKLNNYWVSGKISSSVSCISAGDSTVPKCQQIMHFQNAQKIIKKI